MDWDMKESGVMWPFFCIISVMDEWRKIVPNDKSSWLKTAIGYTMKCWRKQKWQSQKRSKSNVVLCQKYISLCERLAFMIYLCPTYLIFLISDLKTIPNFTNKTNQNSWKACVAKTLQFKSDELVSPQLTWWWSVIRFEQLSTLVLH